MTKRLQVGKDQVMRQRRVLVIEDDAAVRLALEVFLASEDGIAEVVTAENGDTGIENARRLQPDVIVTDSSMPGMAGEELGRSLRESCPGATIISFSGLIRNAPWADHRIQKGGPDTFEELARAVGDAPPIPHMSPPGERSRTKHDLRNALTPLAGYASILDTAADQIGADQIREIAQRMSAAVDRLNEMVDRL